MRALFLFVFTLLNVGCIHTLRVPPAELAGIRPGRPAFAVSVEARTPVSPRVGAHVDGAAHMEQHEYVIEGSVKSAVTARVEEAAQRAGYAVGTGPGQLLLELRRFKLETRGMFAGGGTHTEVEGTLHLISPAGAVLAQVPVTGRYDGAESNPDVLFPTLDRSLVSAFAQLEAAAASPPADTASEWAQPNGPPPSPPQAPSVVIAPAPKTDPQQSADYARAVDSRRLRVGRIFVTPLAGYAVGAGVLIGTTFAFAAACGGGAALDFDLPPGCALGHLLTSLTAYMFAVPLGVAGIGGAMRGLGSYGAALLGAAIGVVGSLGAKFAGEDIPLGFASLFAFIFTPITSMAMYEIFSNVNERRAMDSVPIAITPFASPSRNALTFGVTVSGW